MQLIVSSINESLSLYSKPWTELHNKGVYDSFLKKPIWIQGKFDQNEVFHGIPW